MMLAPDTGYVYPEDWVNCPNFIKEGILANILKVKMIVNAL